MAGLMSRLGLPGDHPVAVSGMVAGRAARNGNSTMAESRSASDTLRAFFECLGEAGSNLPSPFISENLIGPQRPTARLTGLLAQSNQQEEAIDRTHWRNRGVIEQDHVSRGWANSTSVFSNMLEEYRAAEVEKVEQQERWFGNLPATEKTAFLDICRAISTPVIGKCLESHPSVLHGPLARLAILTGHLSRRWAAVREEVLTGLTTRGLTNSTIVESFKEGLSHREAAAKDLIVEAWLRGLSAEESAALDEQPCGDEPSENPLAKSDSLEVAPKKKRSTSKGEAEIKIIAALTLHHEYSDQSCLNPAPIGSNELARRAKVSKDAASQFFKKEFGVDGGHGRYQALCLRNPVRIASWLKALNGDYRMNPLFEEGDLRSRDDA
jgi:hypothetical protein